ncbi:MAG: C40 family peptidase [Armatimonadetes bacterium]|nr:C40 family peptidase [Armatimonadota bacterium]HOM82639.1 C40 family peptidase [Armatimonadota bacterium]
MGWLVATIGVAAPIHAHVTSSEIAITLESVNEATSTPIPGVGASFAARGSVSANERTEAAPGAILVAQAPQKAANASQSSTAKSEPRLGIVLKDATPIYRRATSNSPVLFRCNKDTALALVGQTKKYYAVLMIDRSYGFVEKSRVELHDQSVRINPDELQASHRIVQIAMEYIGVPYVWGGNTRNGLDCSGFVKAVFARMGVTLPRVAREQVNVGRAVRWGELAPGDRLYFSSKGHVIDHTGIYIGGGRFIHASGGAGAVVVSAITEPKYYNTLVAARRI